MSRYVQIIVSQKEYIGLEKTMGDIAMFKYMEMGYKNEDILSVNRSYNNMTMDYVFDIEMVGEE